MPSAVSRVPSSGSTATSTSGPQPGADPLAVEQHRRLVLLALADHDDALHGDRVDHPPHQVDRGPVGGVLVAPPDPAGGAHRACLGDAHELEREVAVGNGRVRNGSHGCVDPTPAGASAAAASAGSSVTTIDPRDHDERPADERGRSDLLVEQYPGEQHGRDGLEEREDARGLRRDVPQQCRVGERREAGEDDPEQQHRTPLAGRPAAARARRASSAGAMAIAPTRQSQNATVSGAALREQQPLGEDHEHRERQGRAEAAGERPAARRAALLAAAERDERDARRRRARGRRGRRATAAPAGRPVRARPGRAGPCRT